MTILIIAALVFLIGAAGVVYAIRAPKKEEIRSEPPTTPAVHVGEVELQAAPASEAAWASEAGAEFAGLGEPARCDLIFAMAELDDASSLRLLIHALDDPSQTVALAAAHALARSGHIEAVRAYAQTHEGERSTELLQLVSLLA